MLGKGVIKLVAPLEQEWGLLINPFVANPVFFVPTQQHILSRQLPSRHYPYLADAVKPFPAPRTGFDPGAAGQTTEFR